MSRTLVDRIVGATLYEGYVLYPYSQTSVKNQVRWTFGGVYPRAYSEASRGAEPWMAQTECLLRGGEDARVEVRVRFLHLITRTAGVVATPLDELVDGEVPAYQPVESVRVAGVVHRGWEEATEREVSFGAQTIADLGDRQESVPLEVPGGRTVEPLSEPGTGITALLVRSWEPLAAEVKVSASRVSSELYRVSVLIGNSSDLEQGGGDDRDLALRRALVATHVVLNVEGGHWLSLADPPPDAVEAAQACRNIGMWPVLVGEPGDDQTILASPIILEDHPRVAPESAGELFDSTEIDEILSLRILALTDDEKAEMRSADPRTRAMLERTEALSEEAMLRLHGTIRELRPARGREP